jgi:hypothetical protein
MIVLNKRANVKWIGDIKLMPGSNTIPDDVWSAAKSRFPKIAQWMQPTMAAPEGELVEVAGQTIADLSEIRAAAVVLECADPVLLAEWRKDETRPRVLEAFALVDQKVAELRAKSLEKKAAREQREKAARG